MQSGDTLLGYHVQGAQLLYDEGYQKRWRLWLRGHHAHLPNSRLIQGWSGPETVYLHIEPNYRIIEVL